MSTHKHTQVHWVAWSATSLILLITAFKLFSSLPSQSVTATVTVTQNALGIKTGRNGLLRRKHFTPLEFDPNVDLDATPAVTMGLLMVTFVAILS